MVKPVKTSACQTESHVWARKPREQLVSRVWWCSFGWNFSSPRTRAKCVKNGTINDESCGNKLRLYLEGRESCCIGGRNNVALDKNSITEQSPSQPLLESSRNDPPHQWRGEALRDDSNNICGGDQLLSGEGSHILSHVIEISESTFNEALSSGESRGGGPIRYLCGVNALLVVEFILFIYQPSTLTRVTQNRNRLGAVGVPRSRVRTICEL